MRFGSAGGDHALTERGRVSRLEALIGHASARKLRQLLGVHPNGVNGYAAADAMPARIEHTSGRRAG